MCERSLVPDSVRLRIPRCGSCSRADHHPATVSAHARSRNGDEIGDGALQEHRSQQRGSPRPPCRHGQRAPGLSVCHRTRRTRGLQLPEVARGVAAVGGSVSAVYLKKRSAANGANPPCGAARAGRLLRGAGGVLPRQNPEPIDGVAWTGRSACAPSHCRPCWPRPAADRPRQGGLARSSPGCCAPRAATHSDQRPRPTGPT